MGPDLMHAKSGELRRTPHGHAWTAPCCLSAQAGALPRGAQQPCCTRLLHRGPHLLVLVAWQQVKLQLEWWGGLPAGVSMSTWGYDRLVRTTSPHPGHCAARGRQPPIIKQPPLPSRCGTWAAALASPPRPTSLPHTPLQG